MDLQGRLASKLEMTTVESLTVGHEWLQLHHGRDTYDMYVKVRRAWKEAERVSMDAGYPFEDRFGRMVHPTNPPRLFKRVMEQIRRGAKEEGQMLV
eukprot:2704386-Alexandrium_andersonii.AAC.1